MKAPSALPPKACAYSAAFYVRILKCTNESHRYPYIPLLLLKHIFR